MKRLLCLSGLIIYVFACCPLSATKPSTPIAETAIVQPSAVPSEPTDTSMPTRTLTLPTDTRTPEPVTVRVAPDGSADYLSLEMAVDAVPTGSIIILEPGTYRLTRPLDIRKTLSLVGAGMDQTEIVSEAKGYVVRFSGHGSFTADDITFRHQGTAVADVVVVEGGGIAFARCRFTGAVYKWGKDGAGLRLQGSTSGVLQDCVAVENDAAGILVEDQAQPTLQGNVCTDNEYYGIDYEGNAGGTARQNECSGNEMGILVGGQARPTLEGNVCTDNEIVGIGYFNNAGGVARQNECSGNKEGILVGDQARPTLEGNVCTDNGLGIGYGGNAGGVARQNECSGNKVGIVVDETADPDLVDNDCHDNAEEDIRDLRP